MKSNVKKLIVPRIQCPKLKRKVSLARALSKEDQYLLLDTLGVNDTLRANHSDVEEYYQELTYTIEGVR